MSFIWNFFGDGYRNIFFQHADPRVRSWPMVDSDFINYSIIAAYAIFINYLGPRIMKNRKPFDLRRIMVPYNIALVIVNFYIFYQYAKIRWFGDLDVTCDTIHTSKNPLSFRLAEITWWFYLTKYVELLDTVFFVLRKKDNQLSKLHIIHHTFVPIIVWAELRFEPGGYNTFFPQANAFVHSIMYTYYALAAFGEEMQEQLWFKKYITMTQLVQFILVLLYFISRPLVGCHMSKLSYVSNIALAGFFFVLFINFYWHCYIKPDKEAIADKKAARHVTANGKID